MEPKNKSIIKDFERLAVIIISRLDKKQFREAGDLLNYTLGLYAQFIEINQQQFNQNLRNVLPNAITEEELIESMFGSEVPKTTKQIFNGVQTHSSFNEILLTLNGVFYRVWFKANKEGDYDFAYLTVKKIIEILKNITTKVDYQEFHSEIVQMILNLLYDITKEGSKNDDDSKSYISFSAYYWYFQTIFNSGFNFKKYSQPLDRHLFLTFKYLINRNQDVIFYDFVESLIGGQFNRDSSDFATYSLIIDEAYQPFDKLYYRIDQIISAKDFFKWQRDFEASINNLAEEKLTQEFLLNVRLLKQRAQIRYLYNNMRLTVIGIASYCLFKEKYNYVHTLITFNQPSDSNATFTNEDINPNNILELIKFINYQDTIESNVWYLWDGHHSLSRYFFLYYLLLISNYSKQGFRHGVKLIDSLKEIQFKAVDLDLDSVRVQVETLMRYVNFLRDEKVEKVFGKQDIHIDGIKTFCKEVIKKINAEVEHSKIVAKVDSDIKSTFFDNVLESYNSFNKLKSIFKYLNKLKYLEFSGGGDSENIGVNEITVKDAFTNESNSIYIDWGAAYARKIVEPEFFYRGKEILSSLRSVTMTKDEFKDQIKNYGKQWIVITSNVFYSDIFGLDENFIPEWKDDSKTEDLKDTGYAGRYNQVLLFNLFSRFYSNAIWIIDTSKLGNYSYYTPKVEYNKGGIVKESIYFELNAYSEDSELLQATLSNSPEWLTVEYPGQSERSTFLLKQVLLRIVVCSRIVGNQQDLGFNVIIHSENDIVAKN